MSKINWKEMSLGELEELRGKLFAQYLEVNEVVSERRKAEGFPVEGKRFVRGFNIEYGTIKSQSMIVIEDQKIVKLSDINVFDGALINSAVDQSDVDEYALKLITDGESNVSVFEGGLIKFWKLHGKVMKEW